MKKTNIILALVLIAGGAFAQTWTMDKNHSKLGFGITHMLISQVDGGFKTFDASITSSTDDFSDAVFDVSADVASINTDNENRDKDLRSANYFDAEKFPKLTFNGKSLKKVEWNKYKLSGDLTIKGITKPVELDVVLNGPIVHPRSKKSIVGFKISGTVKRTDFGVGAPGGTMVSEDVLIIANGEFVKQ